MKYESQTKTRSESVRPGRIAPAEKKHTVANYVPSLIAEYQGNEFIEALGKPLTGKALSESMTIKPRYDEAERNEPASIRKQKLLRLNRAYVPLAIQHSIAETLGNMIREGYINRSPSKPQFNSYLQESYDRRTLEGIVESAPDVAALCESYAIIGISGVGKSFLTRRALAHFPSLIWHPHLRKYQVPYIIVECPHNGTIKQLILNFFSQLDKVAYTNYEARYEHRKMSVEELIREINWAAHLHGIGLIVIDEIQHARGTKGAATANLFMNFLVRFVNTSVAPVVIIGTMSSLEMLQADFRQARRMLGAVLPNYKPGAEWDSFLKGIWQYQWTKTRWELSEELNKSIYAHTQGVPALAVKLYQYAQRRAIETHTETLSVELFDQVAREELSRVAPMVEALATNDLSKLIRYGDLAIPNFLQSETGEAESATGLTMADLYKHVSGQAKGRGA